MDGQQHAPGVTQADPPERSDALVPGSAVPPAAGERHSEGLMLERLTVPDNTGVVPAAGLTADVDEHGRRRGKLGNRLSGGRGRRHADRGAWRRYVRTPLFVYVAAVELAAVIWTVLVSLHAEVSHADLWRGLLLCVSCAVFEILSHRVASMRTRLASGPHVDMGSVWSFAAVVALPPPLAACIAAFVALTAAQARRKGPGAFYREVFNGATNVVTCLAASAIIGQHRLVTGHSSDFVVLLFVVLGIVMFFLINSALVGGAIYASSSDRSLSLLYGTMEENWLELATLTLGALIAVALVDQPLLTPGIIIPLLLLQRGALVKHLEEAASTDQKTGLLNATTWRHISDNEVARAVRNNQQVAVLIVDMDNFKDLNDTHGHLLGDDVLKAVAACLTEELRTYDPVGRFGGEEFVALLTDSGPERAQAAAERILQRVRNLRVPSRDGGGTVTGMSASIGAACFPGNGPAIEDLLMSADAALYRAKRSGRDRVVVAAGDDPVTVQA